MTKWEFDILDLHGLGSMKVVIADHIKRDAKRDIGLANLLNLAWGIYIRNAPPFLTVPIPEGRSYKELVIFKKGDEIHIK